MSSNKHQLQITTSDPQFPLRLPSGKTSGTPPTLVDTTIRPQAAASTLGPDDDGLKHPRNCWQVGSPSLNDILCSINLCPNLSEQSSGMFISISKENAQKSLHLKGLEGSPWLFAWSSRDADFFTHSARNNCDAEGFRQGGVEEDVTSD